MRGAKQRLLLQEPLARRRGFRLRTRSEAIRTNVKRDVSNVNTAAQTFVFRDSLPRLFGRRRPRSGNERARVGRHTIRIHVPTYRYHLSACVDDFSIVSVAFALRSAGNHATHRRRTVGGIRKVSHASQYTCIIKFCCTVLYRNKICTSTNRTIFRRSARSRRSIACNKHYKNFRENRTSKTSRI